MPQQVCNTAQLTCTMGAAPGVLMVLPVNMVMTSNQPAPTSWTTSRWSTSCPSACA